jgi:hypothetical protein
MLLMGMISFAADDCDPTSPIKKKCLPTGGVDYVKQTIVNSFYLQLIL